MTVTSQQGDDQTIDATAVIGQPGNSGANLGLQRQARKTRFSPGDLLSNRFLIIRFLGSGGMGEVYEAQDRFLQNTRVALKTISLHMASSPEAQDRFAREVLLARQITHPNVCPVYHIDHHEDAQGVCCFLSMKLLYGETLSARLRRESCLPVEDALSVIRDTAGALHAAHQAGIIHRDIKPSNIMLDGSGAETKAVVMDFGLARAYDSDMTVPGSTRLVGTPGYIAPELLRGQPASVASDLYAFGLVMHEIFGGRKPTGDKSSLQMGSALRTRGAPSFLPALIRQCLADDPQKRCRAFQQALFAWNLDAGAGHPVYQINPFWTRRRWLAAAASAGGVVGGGVAWEWDNIFAALHPLPRRRFVALVGWPVNSDLHLTAMLSGVIDAIERELSRAEAFDHDLLVLPAPGITKGESQLNQISHSLGANLMLASSVIPHGSGIQLSLRVLDSAARVLRSKGLVCALDELTLLPEMAVRAAAELLGVSQYVKATDRLNPGTLSADAYHAYQLAESLRRKPNDEGLDAAIEQYRTAVEQDSHYALAHARLAMAYCRLYGLRGQPAALDLAQANAATALGLDGHQVGAHLALGFVWEYRGQRETALAEMDKALALDPANPQSVIWQARVYSELQQFSKAEQMFHRVLKSRPNYWLAYVELGEVLNRQGKYVAALRAYRSANLAQPQNSLPLNNIGQVSLVLGQLQEARESLEKSLSLSPSGLAAANLAATLRAEGKYPAALKSALRAVELEPTDDENWLELGDCYYSLPGRRADALKAYSRAAEEAGHRLEMDPSSAFRWMQLALYQAKTENLKAARATVRKADSLGAKDLDSQLCKARILELTSQRQDAIATLTACFRRGATKFEIASIPDLQSLRADSRYLTVFHP